MGFHLPKTSKKEPCPACFSSHKRKTFKPYVDDNENVINVDIYGRCDRVNECGYHVKPTPESMKGRGGDGVKTKPIHANIIFPKDEILNELFRKPSNLHRALAAKGISEDFLYDNGCLTTAHGLTAFVFRNIDGKVCNIKYFKYKENGKRDHDFTSYSLKQPEQRNEFVEIKYTMPLFGENELKDHPSKTVCIVESEKSKLIAMFHYPDFVWVACGSANGLSDGTEGTADKITPLKDRMVYWVNDNDAAARGVWKKDDKDKDVFAECSSVRNGKKHIKKFHIADLFQNQISGYDIGDACLDGLKVNIVPTWSRHTEDKRWQSYVPPNAERMKKEYEGAMQIGETSGINKEFDSVFSWMRTHVNAFYGWPKDGKSLTFEFLSLVKAKKSGWKTCMFKHEDMGSFFENGRSNVTADRLYAKLAWTLTGKTPFEHYAKKHGSSLLSWDEYQEAVEWIKKYFFVVNPSDRKYKNIFDEFKYFHEVFGIDHFGIDPWNTVGLENVERGDERLIQAFVHTKEFALATNTTVSIVNHPGSRHDVKEKAGPNKDAFKVVTQFMQLGGSAWDIKMDGQFSIQRPFRHEDANSPIMYFWNLNQRDSEIVGAERGCYQKIEFDRNRRQYYFDGVCPIDGSIKVLAQTTLPFTPTWHRDRKKKKDFNQHIKEDWVSPKDSDEPDWVTGK
jgi:hypothetical protein